jgi:hypothetical protein
MPPYLCELTMKNTFIAFDRERTGKVECRLPALYAPSGELKYYREGKVAIPMLHDQLNKLVDHRTGDAARQQSNLAFVCRNKAMARSVSG